MFCFYSCYLWDCGEHMGTMYRCPFHTVPMVNLSLSCFLVNVKLLNNKTNKKDTCVICLSDFLPQRRSLVLSLTSPGNKNHVTMLLVCLSVFLKHFSTSESLMEQKRSQFLHVCEKKLHLCNGGRSRLMIPWEVRIGATWQHVMLQLAWACCKIWASREVAVNWRHRG